MKLWDELTDLIAAFDEKERNRFIKHADNFSPKIQEVLSLVLNKKIAEFEILKKSTKGNVVSNRFQRTIEVTQNFIIESFPRIENKAIRLIRVHRALFYKGLYDQARSCLEEALKYCLKYQLWTLLNDINLCIDQIKRYGTLYPEIFSNKFMFHIADLSIEALNEENEFNKLFEEVYREVFRKDQKKNLEKVALKYRRHPLMQREYFISYRSQARQFNIHRMIDMLILDYESYGERSKKMFDLYQGCALLKEVHFYGLLQAAVGTCDAYVNTLEFEKYRTLRTSIRNIAIPNQRLKAYMIGSMRKVDLRYYSNCNLPFASVSTELLSIENEILDSKTELSLNVKTAHPLYLCFIYVKFKNFDKAEFWLSFYRENREIHSDRRKDIHRVATVMRILLNYEIENVDKCSSDCNNAIRNIKQYGLVYETEKLVVKFFRQAIKCLHDKNQTLELIKALKSDVDLLSKNNIYEKEYKVKYIDWSRWCEWKIL